MLVPIVISLGLFAMTFGIVYMIVTARNRERMALIEKGADPTLFETVKKNQPNKVIKWGLLLFGVGLGFVVGDIMEKNGMMSEDYAYVSMICVFGGIALIVAYFFQKRQEKEEIAG